MEPNIFVSYVKADFYKGTWHVSKAFIIEEDANLYNELVLWQLRERLPAFEFKAKVLRLGLNAMILPLDTPEPPVAVCAGFAVMDFLEAAQRIVGEEATEK